MIICWVLKYLKIVSPNFGIHWIFLWHPRNRNSQPIFFKKKINTEDKLIDLGCGNGSFVKFVKEKNIKAKGYDLDTVDLENSKIPE